MSDEAEKLWEAAVNNETEAEASHKKRRKLLKKLDTCLKQAKLYKAHYECPNCHHTLKLEFETRPGLGVYVCPKCKFKAELLIKNPTRNMV